jgi:eukaryotic-like serine/threonine-protein kinase
MLSRIQATEDAVHQFKREMAVVEKLDHPNIVRFLESGSHQGAFYFVMELCDGGSLADCAGKSGGKLPLSQVKVWILQALTGLAFAHSKGFVHRDIKPANILIHRNSARISDFGMSKSFQKAGLSGMSITGHFSASRCCPISSGRAQTRHRNGDSSRWKYQAGHPRRHLRS